MRFLCMMTIVTGDPNDRIKDGLDIDISQNRNLFSQFGHALSHLSGISVRLLHAF